MSVIVADYIKDPDATLDYTVDWSIWLPTGDTITASSWVISPGLTVGPGPGGGPTSTFSTTSATIWLSGGTSGQLYAAVNHITTANGRIDDRTINLRCQQR